MSGQFPGDLAERVLRSHPLPIADAVGALVSAESAFEERDRVVEAFRAALRTLSAIVLACRIQFGPGPGTESSQTPELIRSLRSRGLTDGQWWAIVRELLRPWAQSPASHPLGDLVQRIHGKKAELPKLIDELLLMRKAETVAHGASGTKAALQEILARRTPQLARLLDLLEPTWARARFAVPLASPSEADERQAAWMLTGDTPARGRWRRADLAEGVRVAPGEVVLVDEGMKPLVSLHPLVLFRRPTPEAIEELFVLDGGTKKGAAYVALPSMAEHRETEAWAVLSRALSDEEPAPENPEIAADRPYRGLASFGPEHAALFFGREEQTEALANRIRRHPLVTVTGPSGSGKTSLLRAGVLPQLRSHRVVTLRPGADPLDALAARVAEGIGADPAELVRKLRQDPASLGAEIAAWARRDRPEDLQAAPYRAEPNSEAPQGLVIFVDQAEEVLTLCRDEAIRNTFATAIASAGASADGPSRVILGVREDFFARLATLPALAGLYSRQVEVVTTPDRDALARTLFFPAKQFGYAFEDEALVTTMVDAVASEPAALALLQFCADRLWEVRDRTWRRLTWDAYRASGGVEGALAAHADGVLAEMSPVQRRVCKGLFLRLVTGERTRSVASRKEIIEGSKEKEEAATVLDRLVAARLVVVSEAADSGEARVELVHEALIRHWAQLATWLSEDEEGQRLAHALRQASKEWDQRGRPSGLVWRGDALVELHVWRKRADQALTDLETAFVSASEREEQRGRRVRRGLIAGGFVALAAFGTFMFFQWRAADTQKRIAESERARAEDQAIRAEVRGLVSEAKNHEPAGRTGKALALYRAAAATERETAETSTSLDLARLYRGGAASLVLAGHHEAVYRVALSPDRKRLVTASLDETAMVWDLETGKLRATLPEHGYGVLDAAFSPDGRTIATATGHVRDTEGSIRLWDAETGQLRKKIMSPKPLRKIAFLPDGTTIVASAGTAGVLAWRTDRDDPPAALTSEEASVVDFVLSPDASFLVASFGKIAVLAKTSPFGESLSKLEGHTGSVGRIAISPDNKTIVTVSNDLTVKVWSRDAAEPQRSFGGETEGYGPRAYPRVPVISPDGRLLVVGDSSGALRMWSLHDGALIRTLTVHKGEIESVVFSPDGRRILTASGDGTAAVIDVVSGALVELLRGHEADLHRAIFADDERVITASQDRTARVWNIADGPFFLGFEGHRAVVSELAASADGKRIVSGSSDKTARVWDASTGKLVATLAGHDGPIRSVAITKDGAWIATGAGGDDRARLWSGSNGEQKHALPGHARGAQSVAFSPKGDLLATSAGDGAVRIWDVASGQEKASLKGHDKSVVDVVFSPSGEQVATASWDGTARLWDVAGKKESIVMKGPEGWVTRVAFSPDGARVAAAMNQEIGVFRTDTGARELALRGHEQPVMDLAWAPSGNVIASACADGTLRTWNAQTGVVVRTFTGHTTAAVDLSFSSDGARLFSASGDGAVKVWDVTSGVAVETLEIHGSDTKNKNAMIALDLGDSKFVTASNDGAVLLWRSAPIHRADTLRASGAATSYRVCRDSLAVVPVAPFPPADSVWAPEDVCKAASAPEPAATASPIP